MCTVSFISCKDGYFITSNRDEKIFRKPAIPPKQYSHNKHVVAFPKDPDAGGTWIAMNENGNAAVLLNGAFRKYNSRPPYERSRGLVLLDIISNDNPLQSFLRLDLLRIEPFTLIIFTQNSLYECRWDGQQKHSCELPAYCSYIWSSVTLYDTEMIQKREQWFTKFLNRHQPPSHDQILHFHRFAGEGDTNNDLNMNRDGLMLTVSITSIKINRNKCTMKYNDLKTGKQYLASMSFISEPTVF